MNRPVAQFPWLVTAIMLLFFLWFERGSSEESISSVSITAFNIQVFGVSKMGKEGVPDILASLLASYDMTFVQEIRDSSNTAIHGLMDLVNAKGVPYDLVLSNRLGRTNSKEQYAVIYRPSVFAIESTYEYDDGVEPDNDTFQREPYVVHVRVKQDNTTFVVIGCHTAPGDAPEEIAELATVYDDAVAKLSEPRALLLGDLNADCSYLNVGERASNILRTDDRFTWLIGDEADTTVSATDCAYDRFITAGNWTGMVVEDSVQVVRYDLMYGMTNTEAKVVSDHYPITMNVSVSPPLPENPGTTGGSSGGGTSGGGTSGGGTSGGGTSGGGTSGGGTSGGDGSSGGTSGGDGSSGGTSGGDGSSGETSGGGGTSGQAVSGTNSTDTTGNIGGVGDELKVLFGLSIGAAALFLLGLACLTNVALLVVCIVCCFMCGIFTRHWREHREERFRRTNEPGFLSADEVFASGNGGPDLAPLWNQPNDAYRQSLR